MAEYIGLPVTDESSSQDPPSYQAVCKLWVKSDNWPLEDAVRLLLNQVPKVFMESESDNVHKSFSIVLELANNCIGESLNAAKHHDTDRGFQVTPIEFIFWAKQKGFPVPAELDLALSVQNKAENAKSANNVIHKQTNHRERVRAIASLLWNQSPTITVRDMVNRPEITEHGCQNQYYAEAVVEGWVKDLHKSK